MFGKRILILAAHPDDEVVACAAAIGRAKQQDAKVFVYYLTHGCLAKETLWPWQRNRYESKVARRFYEAEQAARKLGLFITDRSQRPARHLWRELPQVHAEVKQAIADNNIDQLWVPAYEGGNADHDALNAIGSIFWEEMSVFEFAEYNFFESSQHSHEFIKANGSEKILKLTPQEKAEKASLLKLYASEKQNLNYVKLEQESYRPLADYDYDYAKPPHEGKLWYARFQWVPFKHPRVDFTDPKDVSKAIKAFLSLA